MPHTCPRCGEKCDCSSLDCDHCDSSDDDDRVLIPIGYPPEEREEKAYYWEDD